MMAGQGHGELKGEVEADASPDQNIASLDVRRRIIELAQTMASTIEELSDSFRERIGQEQEDFEGELEGEPSSDPNRLFQDNKRLMDRLEWLLAVLREEMRGESEPLESLQGSLDHQAASSGSRMPGGQSHGSSSVSTPFCLFAPVNTT